MTQFQRRHYEFIARTIRNLRWDSPNMTGNDIEAVARAFANALAGTNEHFKTDRFLEACRPDTTYREKSR